MDVGNPSLQKSGSQANGRILQWVLCFPSYVAQGTKFFTALSDEARLIKFLGVDQALDAYAFKTFTRDKHPIAGEQN